MYLLLLLGLMLLDKLYLLCDFGTCTKLCKCITKYPPPPAAQQAGNLKRYPAFSMSKNSNRNIHYLEATCHSSITKRNISLVIFLYFCFDFHRIYDSSPMFHYYWGLCYWTNCIYCATLVLAQNYVNVLLNTRRPQRHNKQEI